ncbi:MAG: hypothetical protein GY745_07505 [Actinomycetia bacterium]|nr:hypothetical protein [Actinomycetes bacterium]
MKRAEAATAATVKTTTVSARPAVIRSYGVELTGFQLGRQEPGVDQG